jgi:nitrite reductase (NO-forming)
MHRVRRLSGGGRLLALTALGSALVLAACAGSADRSSSAAAGTPVATTADPVEFEVELGDIWVEPGRIAVPAGAPVVLHVTNVGNMPHDLKLDGHGTKILGPGESESITVGPFSEPVRLVCTVPGHEAAGMVMDVHVE